jgi:predicted ATPase
MITEWRVDNFKSYRGQHHVPLSLINVIAGANSSGKSTLIQSILSLKQTLQFAGQDKSLLLNGPLVKLGSFEDVLSTGADSAEISIGFDCKFSLSEMESLGKEVERAPYWFWSRTKAEDYLSGVSLTAKWEPSRITDEVNSHQAVLNPSLISTHLDIARSSSGSQFATINRSHATGGATPFDMIMDASSVEEVSQNKPAATIVGGYAERFLPRFAAVEFNSSAKRASDIASNMFSGTFNLGSPGAFDNFKIPPRVLGTLLPWLESRSIDVGEEDLKDGIIVSKFKLMVAPEVDKINYMPMLTGLAFAPRKESSVDAASLSSIIATTASLMAEEFAEERIIEPALPANLREASDIIAALFKSAVKYLGPLRNPPRPVYQLEAVPGNSDVGFRGEHTAAILDLNRGKRVSYIGPPDEKLENDFFSHAKRKSATLHDAVVDWLSYLGVAEEVSTSDEGVFGNRLRVQTSGSGAMHDLTNVGVGVSQVLPIVVMALLAPPASFIILEQPELHLHPKVQARLADFFIALAVDGKQTLSETHSEYLIDRLRLRVALSENAAIREAINIMFSRKANVGTSLVNIELTEYGSILEWPDDFFDQAQGDVGRILKAAALKRRRGAA